MTDFTYSRVAALNFTTVPTTVGRSATGSVYAIGDTTFTTPLNVTTVVGGVTGTSISSDANGFFPDFTVANRTSVVFKQAGTSFTSVLTTTDPVPGPQGTPGNTGAAGAKGDRGDLASWQATTFYPLNQLISNPVGDLVKVTTAHTSTGSYDATKFDYVVPPTLTPAALAVTIDDQIEGSTYLPETFVPKTPNLKNAVTGWFHVDDFGAVGDGIADDTAAIQACIDAAASDGSNRSRVHFSAKEYAVTGIVGKKGTSLVGSGIGGFGTAGTARGTRIKQLASQTVSVVRYDEPVSANGRTYAGPFLIEHMEIVGNTTSTGFGLDFTTPDGRACCIQDTTTIRNLLIRGASLGGIRFPQGAFPLHVADVNCLWNGGPGITYIRGTTGASQAIHFDNISGDGNVVGLIYIDDNNTSGAGEFLITNLKSEKRVNVAYGNVAQQDNAVVLYNTRQPVTLINCNHYASDETGIVPGPMVKATSSSSVSPTIKWMGTVLVVAGRTGTPLILDDQIAGITIPSTVINGEYAQTRDSRKASVGNSLDLFGNPQYALPSVGSNAVGVSGNTPQLFLYETDAGTNAKLWSWTASGGNLSLRTHTDTGSAGILAIELVRSASNVPTIKLNNSAVEAATLESTSNAGSLVLKSPNGTRHRIQVSDAGALSATAL